MKSFLEQFSECKKAKLHKTGPLQRWKDYPGMLPAPWHPAAPKIAKVLEKNPNAGTNPILCLKFGGECSSAHPQCRRMRGVPRKKGEYKFISRRFFKIKKRLLGRVSNAPVSKTE